MKIWIVNVSLLIGFEEDTEDIKRDSGKNVSYVMDILMMMELAIFYLCKKSQIIKKHNANYAERQIILFK